MSDERSMSEVPDVPWVDSEDVDCARNSGSPASLQDLVLHSDFQLDDEGLCQQSRAVAVCAAIIDAVFKALAEGRAPFPISGCVRSTQERETAYSFVVTRGDFYDVSAVARAVAPRGLR